MTDTLKVLAQSNPSSQVLTDLYTVPGATSVIISSVIVCNQNNIKSSFRISLAVAGAADDPKQYIYYDVDIAGNDTFVASIGISLATTDVVRIYASTTSLSFNLSGVQVT